MCREKDCGTTACMHLRVKNFRAAMIFVIIPFVTIVQGLRAHRPTLPLVLLHSLFTICCRTPTTSVVLSPAQLPILTATLSTIDSALPLLEAGARKVATTTYLRS